MIIKTFKKIFDIGVAKYTEFHPIAKFCVKLFYPERNKPKYVDPGHITRTFD